MKKYYAEYCPWGVNISYQSFDGNAYTFYAFDTKKARDEWVEKHEYNSYSGNYVAGEVTRKTIERVIGKHFSLRRPVDEAEFIDADWIIE